MVKPFASGALLAVVDGIGHGEEAAAASKIAVGTLLDGAQEPLISLAEEMNRALAGTRGVVLGLARLLFQEDRLEWLGIGNIEAAILSADGDSAATPLLTQPGVVGHEMPLSLDLKTVPLRRGDMIVMATDGIEEGFVEKVFPRHAPQQIASAVLDDFASARDDALILVTRYLGRSP
jgi:phosphoserine phosphatase RsbX